MALIITNFDAPDAGMAPAPLSLEALLSLAGPRTQVSLFHFPWGGPRPWSATIIHTPEPGNELKFSAEGLTARAALAEAHAKALPHIEMAQGGPATALFDHAPQEALPPPASLQADCPF